MAKNIVTRRDLLKILPATAAAGIVCTRDASARDWHPHMREALDALRTAERELSAAQHDKGGHRQRALRLVRQAVAEVERGERYDNRH